MKNATKHAEELKSLCRKLVKEHKPGERASQEPLWALVRGAMSYDVADDRGVVRVVGAVARLSEELHGTHCN